MCLVILFVKITSTYDHKFYAGFHALEQTGWIINLMLRLNRFPN